MQRVYKILTRAEWDGAVARGVYEGSDVDARDGFIHLSTAAQVAETARRHFAGRDGLVLVAFDPGALQVRWEPSRGGALFPHVYGTIDPGAALAVFDLPRAPSGEHVLPRELG